MQTKLLFTIGLAALAAAALVGTAGATYAGKNGRIAIAEHGSGGVQIWAVLPDGSDPKQLTTEGFNATPAFSRDGRRMAYLSDRGGGTYDIWLMRADGTAAHQLTHMRGNAEFPDFAPGGLRVAFDGLTAGSAKDDIYVIGTDGKGLTRLTHGQGNNDRPVFSPDGRRIAFVSDRTGVQQVWVMNVDGTRQHQLTTKTLAHYAVDWSPDGKRIVFDEGGPGQPTAIVVAKADGTDQTKITHGATRDFGAVWSPDGRQIAFVRVFGFSSNAEQDVYVMNANGTGQHALHRGAKQLVPAWQPLP
jgi:Tol biopolymer transport system component